MTHSPAALEEMGTRPTRASVLDVLSMLRKERDIALACLGPCPPWWRPLKRRLWKHEAWLIHTAMLEKGQAFWREAYGQMVVWP